MWMLIEYLNNNKSFVLKNIRNLEVEIGVFY